VASLKELKLRINSVKSTQKITKAKQMVAAAKLRKAQAAAEAARPYAGRLADVMASLASKVQVGEGSPKLLAGTGKDQVHLLVVANSDRGLCGAFNANIVKAAKAKAQELIAQGKTVKFYLIGRKGRPAIRRDFPNAIVGTSTPPPCAKPALPKPRRSPTNCCPLRGRQVRRGASVLRNSAAPCADPDRAADHPRARPKAAAEHARRWAVVDYEPDEEAILADLLPRYLRVQLFGALLENMASEQGASMTAMDNATRNAGELIKKLTIQYNRSRQAAITTELVEIIAGAEAL
jgi:F-type H+-transporting ATPase subunit gamma